MRVDLHNHTSRCNHATGTVDDYIKKAIDLGIDIYGFSEHAPMDFDPKYRIRFDEMAEYERDILDAKERYKKDIKILLGYEVDFLPNYMDNRVLNANVDYLIGSVHFINKWGFDNPEFIREYQNRDIDKIWQDYFDAIEAMVNSGKFDIVGHLDLIKVFKFMPKKDIKLIAKNTLKAIKKSNMVLEINSAGLRKPITETYPSKDLLQKAYELNIPITFSSDAHSVEQVGFGYNEAIKMAKDIGYTKAYIFENRDRSIIEL
ncbi:Histidinol-phosphatase [hydrothermal vent metagenome]|uniref:histidinol-phosphatase n=1 Tax=hydrothermal vent metagenome TaxID=652676 RepID=A0A1W1BN70_9ZZZZ